ncbi:NADP-dependent oxidoreductase [Nitriliruptoraceae bacterium ZYF776]|nr:NADP-dependent oxidoreductase [Profundirhabdus halotolerans]
MISSREWHLVRRPDGRPTDDDVRLVTTEVGEPAEGQVRVRNLVMSVEPYMRGRMEETSGYAESYVLDEPMHGRAVGEVTASAADDLPVGTLVLTEAGWREHALVAAADCTEVPATGLPPSVHLGALGITGMTAWVGLERIAQLRPGETVLVTSAAGGVGAIAVQMAKARGCTVLGSAGSEAKVTWLRDELGVDAAFSHRGAPYRHALRDALAGVGADGLDVVFENVGGDHLEAAIRHLNLHARIALCGMIATYNATEPVPGPRNLIRLIWQRARLEGFLLGDHDDARPAFEAEMIPWLEDGTIQNPETAVEGGIEAAFDAFLGMLDGTGIGKVVVPLAAPSGAAGR